ncbi:MAG: hypothetical protein ACRYF0_07730 [Janthinobacterium lividum]
MMLRPEVAEQFELTSGVTRVHVSQLGHDYDLSRISLAEAEQLVAVPGFDRLRRKAVPANDVGPVAATTGPTKGRKKKRA